MAEENKEIVIVDDKTIQEKNISYSWAKSNA